MKFLRILTFITILSSLFALNSCGLYKKVDQREMPDGASAKARKNIEEGRGAGLGDMSGRRGGNTNYEFSTANPMWRATLETLDFLPLTTDNSYIIWTTLIGYLKTLATVFLTMAMAAVGISINLSELKSMGYKPFVVGLIAAITVGFISLIYIETLIKFI